jgi:hypothetical protein
VNQSQTSILDAEPYYSRVKTMIEEGETNASIASAIDVSKDSIRRFRSRHGYDQMFDPRTLRKSGVRVRGDDAEVTTPVVPTEAKPYPHMDDPDAMLLERGLDPEQWAIDGATVNEWDGPQAGGSVVTYHQAKLQLRRKQPEASLLPVRSDGWVAPPKKPMKLDEPQLIVVVGDQQAPFQDPHLHELFCGWLEENRPQRGVSLGDTVDLSDISKHRKDPDNLALVNECLQSGYDLLRGYVTSSPDTAWQILDGNHDERLRNVLLDNPSAQPLYGIKRVDTDSEQGEEVLAIDHLMRLDELGIEYVKPHGAYSIAQIKLTDRLAVAHGWLAQKGSGTSALATLNHLRYSIIVGHTHRQSIVYHTSHDIDDEPSTLVAAEAGCMCRVNQQIVDGRMFPNYTPKPDWQQGFCTVTVHPDGYFRVDNATYVNGTLLWRDQLYR